jgi:hypothetical protein
MSNFKIFKRDGMLWGNEFPEIPAVSISANQDAARMRSYNRAVESACGTAVMVIGLDESALILNGFACEDDLYSVPTGWTVEYVDACAHDSCPEAGCCDHCKEPKRIARLIPLKEPEISDQERIDRCHGFTPVLTQSSGIVATGIAEQDSPVIPEGSEKPNDLPTKRLWGDSWGQSVHRAGYKRTADKPAIDDTLKVNELWKKYRRMGWAHEYAEDGIINQSDLMKIIKELKP